jgi:hypothetical protein
MHLDMSRYIEKSMYIEKLKCLIIWNGGVPYKLMNRKGMCGRIE